ncbi:TRAP transporter permease [Roseovarius mucosus]|uniref:TRAP transporter permease n=1 Tax=Roseovarius mucosus TaxID=215743 RepID=UPI003F725073
MRQATEAATADGTLKALKDAETGLRTPGPQIALLISATAILWAVFQLYQASPLPLRSGFMVLDDTQKRSVHLAFAIFIGFLTYPAFTRSPRDRVPLLDWLLALTAVFCTLYIVLFYQSVVSRTGGVRTGIEITVALVGLAMVLEITRRALGMPLVIVALVFIGYSFTGPHLPDLIAHRGASLNRFVDHMWLTTEGVFGLPLGVSNSLIFLFVLFGALLDKAGAGNYFIQLSFALLGHLRGGPAKAAVVSSGMTGVISGSAIANIVTTGTFTIPLMKRVGFSGEKAAAIETSASINGQIMPPIMGAAAFLMTEFVGISYFEVIKHAFLPAVLSYVALFYIVHLEAVKADMPLLRRAGQTAVARRLLNASASITVIIGLSLLGYGVVTAIKSAFGDWAMLVAGMLLLALYLVLMWVAARRADLELDDPDAPLIEVPAALPILLAGLYYFIPVAVLVWCLMIERLSPALSVSWAVVTITAVILTQKPLIVLIRHGTLTGAAFSAGIRDLATGMIQGARNMVGVALAMAAAGIVVGVVSLTGVGVAMSGIIDTLSAGNPFLMLVITAVMCIVLGMGLPTTANYIVVASIMAQPLVTLAAQNGLEIPLIAVHLFVFYFGLISGTTPPVAVDAFAAAAVARSSPMGTCVQSFKYSLRTAILPFVFVFNPAILLIGLQGVVHGVLVVAVALVAILAFSAGTQGHFLTRSRRWESALLIVVALSLLRPGFWLDRLAPQYAVIDPARIVEIAEAAESSAYLRMVAEGESFSGAQTRRIAVLPLGSNGASGEDRLWQSAGLAVLVEGRDVLIDNVNFNSPAQRGGLDFDWRIVELQVENDRFAKEWLYIPFLLTLGAIAVIQLRRRRDYAT